MLEKIKVMECLRRSASCYFAEVNSHNTEELKRQTVAWRSLTTVGFFPRLTHKAVEYVLTHKAVEYVLTHKAVEYVLTHKAVEYVLTHKAVEYVLTHKAVEYVLTHKAVEYVLTHKAVEYVLTHKAVEYVLGNFWTGFPPLNKKPNLFYHFSPVQERKCKSKLSKLKQTQRAFKPHSSILFSWLIIKSPLPLHAYIRYIWIYELPRLHTHTHTHTYLSVVSKKVNDRSRGRPEGSLFNS